VVTLFGLNLDIYDLNYKCLKPFNTLDERTRQFILPLIIKDVLNNIEKVECKIHNLKFTGNYTYQNIVDSIGNIKLDSSYKKYSDGSYEERYFKNIHGTNLSIKLHPIHKKRFLPQCEIKLVYKKHKSIAALAKHLPELNVSSVEYAIDLFQHTGKHTPQNVRNLFLLLRHYLYRKGFNKTEFYTNWENYTYYIGTKKDFKIYERGKDKPSSQRVRSEEKGWEFNELDRLRIEYTIKRANIKKMGLGKITEFVQDCKFNEIMKNRFDFRVFKSNSDFPMEWMEYKTNTKNKYFNGFQDEYIEQKNLKKHVGITRNSRKSVKMLSFKLQINKRLNLFNERWKTKSLLWSNHV
jgi:hypothetical protein